MLYLRQSTASQSVLIGPFVDSTDGTTAETALSIANTDIKLSKNGGTMASKNSGGGTHDANGWYAITLDATDTATVGRLQVSCKVAGALVVFSEFQVMEEATFDKLFALSAALNDLAAADIRTAVGLASANLDTQLTAIDDYIDTEIAAIRTVTDAIGTTGTGLSAIPWNAAWDAEVQSEVQDAIEVNHLDHLLAVDYDPAAKPGTATALLNELIESDAGVSRYTANALEQGPSGGGGVADWTADERTALRAILGIPASGTTPDNPTTGILDTIRDLAVGIDGYVVGIDGDTTAILAELPANFGDMAIAAGTGYVIASSVQGNVTGSVASVSGAVGSVTGNVGGNVTGSVGSVLGGINTTGGTITTLDALDTAQDIEHNATQATLAELNNLSAAQVNAEVLDVLNVDTFAESGGVPAATTTIVDKIGVLYDALINEVTVTATKKTFKNASNVAQWEKDITEDGTTYTENKGNAP